MVPKENRKLSARQSERAKLQERLAFLKRELGRVKRQLGRLDASPAVIAQVDRIRRTEALRRKRLRLLLEIDRVESRLRNLPGRGGGRVVQGPKSGITSIVQGGSPGLGRRS